MSQYIDYSSNGQVATIRLNDPSAGNGMSVAMLRELHAAIGKAEQDSDVRAVVLCSGGKNFCVGANLRDEETAAKEGDLHVIGDHLPNLKAIKESSKVYIAAVQGAAAGIGSSYALLCDITIMAEDAYIYQAFLPIGLVPDGGACWLLGRHLGYKRAFNLFLDATKLPARQCLEWGLANEVVSTDSLQQRAAELAASVASKAPLAVAATKQLLHSVFSSDYESVVVAEASHQARMLKSEDAKEGATAFFEKRPPVFKGK